jgi:hypothetical protein
MSNVASSGEVSIDDMLPELLRSVFEILASLGDQYRAEAPLVAPCMLVCRRWKVSMRYRCGVQAIEYLL